MKSVVKLVKNLHVETPVLNAMFMGYFVLMIFSAAMIANTNDQSAETTTVTATKDIPAAPTLTN